MALITVGRGTSWQNITARVDGVSFSDFTEISWGGSLEETLGWGMGLSGRPSRRSHGKWTPDDCALKAFRSEGLRFLQLLSAKSGASNSYSAVEFTLIVNFALMDSEPTSTVVLDRCRVLTVAESHAEGSDNSVMDIGFRPMSVELDKMAGYDRLPQL